MSSYFRVRLSKVPTHLEDDATDVCFSFGASGVTEVLSYLQPDLTYEADIVHQKTHDLDVYFDKSPEIDFFAQLKEVDSHISTEIFEEQSKDWLEEWKKGFEPFQLVGPYWVVPTWHKSPTDPEHSILIDPGMAFGTGTHATTQMAAYFVYKITETLTAKENKNLLDVGTGTGILAMLGSRQGIGSSKGIEIDPEARRVAKENIDSNQIKNVVIGHELIEEIKEKYDIVVANIIDGILVRIRNELLNALKPQGHIFLTGILLEREAFFMQNFIDKSNLKVIRRIEKDEWVGYWLQSP